MGENNNKGLLLESGIILRRPNPAPFLIKTYMLVDDPATDTIVSWNEDGTAFVVWQATEFATDLLPTLFKHSNFSSFVRQLNTYGFRKATTSRWEFRNDMFQRGKMELLSEIQRRKAWRNRQPPPLTTTTARRGSQPPPSHDENDEDQRSSSTSSTSQELNFLVDENKKLKMENGVLNSELQAMKKKCQDLLGLVAIYANEIEKDGGNDDDDNKNRPMLFGVRLEVQEEKDNRKRKKSGQVYDMATRLLSQSCK